MIEPLTAPDCDLRDFQYMPLDVQRLRDSEQFAVESPEASIAAIVLWCASWHQVPAASLPDDDTVLAKLAGYGKVVSAWKKVRAGALRNWEKCSDGRLYHPVVAEKANESWASKLKHSYDRMCDRTRKANKQRDTEKLTPLGIPSFATWNSSGRGDPVPPETTNNSGGIPAENTLKGEVREGRSKGKVRDTVPTPSASEPPNTNVKNTAPAAKKPRTSAAEKADSAAKTAGAWRAYGDAYTQRYGANPVRNRTTNALMKAFVERVGVDESPGVAAHFVRSNRGLYVAATHALNLLVRDAEAIRTEWATNRHSTDTQARQADRTAATSNVFDKLIDERLRNVATG